MERSLARWLPDGKRVVFAALEAGRQMRLYLHDLGSDRPVPLTPEGVDGSWAISPDGWSIAAQLSGSPIRIYDTNGSAPRDVPGLTGRDTPVGWIVDGLLVMHRDEVASRLGEIYTVDINTGRQSSWKNILPRDPAGFLSLVGFRVTPDGRSHAYAWARALSDLYLADGLT